MALFNRKYDSLTQVYKWKKLDIEEEDIFPPGPELCQGPPSVTMSSTQFKERMNDLKTVGDAADIHIGDGHVTFHACEMKKVIDFWSDVRSDYLSELRDVSRDPKHRLQVDAAKRGFNRSFAMKMLETFSRAGTLSKDIKMWFFDDNPACFHFDLDDSSEKGFARFWLAPHQANDLN